jgi:aspartate aminotransferase
MQLRNKSINLNVRGMGKSATLAINELSAELERKGHHVYRMGLGQSPFPVPTSVVQALQNNAHQKDYLPVQGLPELREAVAKFHALHDQVNVRPAEVMIGPGSKELMFLLQIAFYGEIIIPTPCWVSYIPQANIIGRKVRFVATTFEEKWRLSPDHLAQLLKRDNDRYRPRLLILNYPGNPEGNTYTVAELEELAKIAKHHEMIILSDEIYGRIHHDGQHVSIARFYPERTIISAGLSKWCGAGGWRLGTFAFPKRLSWLVSPMTAIASETYTSVSAPIQYAAVTAFQSGPDIADYLFHSRRILKTLGAKVYATLTQAGVKVVPPVGAFYLFPDFSPFRAALARKGIHDSDTLCERLLEETRVAILPGSAFGRPPEELTARLAYVNFDGAEALAVSRQVPADKVLTVEDLMPVCDEVAEALNRIVEWLQTL